MNIGEKAAMMAILFSLHIDINKVFDDRIDGHYESSTESKIPLDNEKEEIICI